MIDIYLKAFTNYMVIQLFSNFLFDYCDKKNLVDCQLVFVWID